MGFDPATGALLPTVAAEAEAGAASKPEAKREEKGAGEQVTVLRSHDILVRIRIRRTIPPTNGSGSGSCYFRL